MKYIKKDYEKVLKRYLRNELSRGCYDNILILAGVKYIDGG